MTLRTAHRTQTATHWAVSGRGGDGHPTFSAPASLTVRWEDTERLIRTENGDEIVSTARMWIDPSVSIAIGDWVLFGTSVSANPTTDSYEVKRVQTLTGLSTGSTEKMVML